MDAVVHEYHRELDGTLRGGNFQSCKLARVRMVRFRLISPATS
jgi:hypothetical protein